jgi:hypothetical protein
LELGGGHKRRHQRQVAGGAAASGAQDSTLCQFSLLIYITLSLLFNMGPVHYIYQLGSFGHSDPGCGIWEPGVWALALRHRDGEAKGGGSPLLLENWVSAAAAGDREIKRLP